VKAAPGLSTKQDNVLFSVTDGEATWHTDGTSVDRVIDVVALLCIRPAAQGGEFGVSNACNAFADIQALLPHFLKFELMRLIPREVMEKGKGQGKVGADWISAIARGSDLLRLRCLRNAFPIYELAVDRDGTHYGESRLRFRYMRFWIESAHAKCGMRLSPFLRIAMDFVDAHLDKLTCYKVQL
jgi:hypothetical protein